jgi:hypothetical protein
MPAVLVKSTTDVRKALMRLGIESQAPDEGYA